MSNTKDYAAENDDIQSAMVKHIRAFPERATRPGYIIWNGQKVYTSYTVDVPKMGELKIEFLSEPREPAQGIDVKVEEGKVFLSGGEAVQTLRTWHDRRFEESVEYRYQSTTGRLTVWNVYHRIWPDGRVTEEKWTGNAGFVVDGDIYRGLVLHCSHGAALKEPDFQQLITRISVSEYATQG